MVQRCCVPLCDTKVGDQDIKGAKVRFHRIPLIPEKFLKWRDQITNFGLYKPEPELTINSRLCSKHFLREDYITGEEQKPGTSGNHVLAKDAVPTIFKWNDETKAELSRAIPYMKKAELQSTLNGLCEKSKNQEVQCSLEEEKLRQDLHRKNNVIRQLLQRLAELEKEKGQNPGEMSQFNTSNDSNDNIIALSKEQQEQPKVYNSETSSSSLSVTTDAPDSDLSTATINSHILISNQSLTVASTENCNNTQIQASPNTPTRDTQNRASVIKRVCDIDRIAKPPKKRNLDYFYNQKTTSE